MERKEKEEMNKEKVYAMGFAKIYPLLTAKAEKKGRTFDEVNEIICWLTGYNTEEIENARNSSVTYLWIKSCADAQTQAKR